MITIDPYEIDFIIAERIAALYSTGALDALRPDGECGYTCESVFGVYSGDIAAIRSRTWDFSGDLWFELTDGRFVPALPVMGDPGPVPWHRIEH